MFVLFFFKTTFILVVFVAALGEFDKIKSSEVSTFRVNMKQMAKDLCSERDRKVSH